MTTIDNSYTQLTEQLKKIFYLFTTHWILEWDQQVNLPEAESCAKLRGAQIGALAESLHTVSTDEQIGTWLGILEENHEKLTPDQQVVVREARRDYDLKTKLPTEFVSKKKKATSDAFHVWAEARKNNDYARFAPYLQRNIDLALEESAYQGFKDNPYDYWVDQFDPGLDTQTVDRLFSELQEELVPLVRGVLDSPKKASTEILKGFPVDAQRTFLTQVIEQMGFDFSRSRIDVALHPFCVGNPSECRITTRFHEDCPLDSLFSSIHEAGHGLYELGLPPEHEGTPLAQAVGSAVHESQSRLWENQIGRSRSFWKYWEPKYREAFKDQLKDIDSETLYRAINAVELNPIRVDSDELTYNLHIILRFTLEKKFFAGELDVKDLPEVWNAHTQSLLGFTPESDAKGCLQDIHWAWSCFGYFPSYCMGNMMAAQLWETVNEALPNLEEDFAKGDFSAMLGWLRTNIHSQGKRYRTLELVEKVTGEPLSPKALIRYLKKRYLPLYS